MFTMLRIAITSMDLTLILSSRPKDSQEAPSKARRSFGIERGGEQVARM